MLSIIGLSAKDQFGPELFPIPGELYCEPVARMFRDDNTGLDLQGDNVIIEALEVYQWIKHHLSNTQRHVGSNFHVQPFQSLLNQSGLLDVVCNETPKYTGNAREFVDQIDQVTTKSNDRVVAMVSVFCYLFPKSVYEELFSRGYKILLDELFESRISHLYGFFVWCSMVGLPTENFIVLSGRYNAHPSIDTSDLKVQNRDMDFDAMGARVVNYPAFFWQFEHNQQTQHLSKGYSVDWGTKTNFEFPHKALFINRAERFHRLLAIAYLHKKDKLDQCLWSMIGHTPQNLLKVLRTIIDPECRAENNLDWFDDDLAETMQSIIPKEIEQDTKEFHQINPKYFEETKFSFVTETIGGSGRLWDSSTSYYPAFSNHQGYYFNPVFRMNHRRYGFITEKTFRPIAVGHPFIVLGNNKLLYTLQQLGFETYNRVWDESYNDQVDDFDRFYQTMDRAIDLMDNGFNERTAKKIAEHNKALFWDSTNRRLILDKWFIEPLLAAYYD